MFLVDCEQAEGFRDTSLQNKKRLRERTVFIMFNLKYLSPSWQDGEKQAFKPRHRAGTKSLPRFPFPKWREEEHALAGGQVLLQEAKSIALFDSLQAAGVYCIQLSCI